MPIYGWYVPSDVLGMLTGALWHSCALCSTLASYSWAYPLQDSVVGWGRSPLTLLYKMDTSQQYFVPKICVACIHTYMHAYINACMSACIHVWMYLFMHYVHMCMYVFIYALRAYVYMYVCIYRGGFVRGFVRFPSILEGDATLKLWKIPKDAVYCVYSTKCSHISFGKMKR